MKEFLTVAIHRTQLHFRKWADPMIRSKNQAPASVQKAGAYLVIGAFVLFSTVSLWKWFQLRKESALREEELSAGPRVRVTQVTRSPAERKINLIGETKPYSSVTLYAKVSGYLKEVKVDKGDQVKKGQILAVIESPETDKDYQGALSEAKNKSNIANRMRTLLGKGLVSQQEAEQAISNEEVAKARLDSQAVQKGYEIIRAPFSGTVTARYADPGALMQNATNSQTSALPVVTVAQLEELRVYVYLDQKDAPYVSKGTPVEISLPDRPDQVRTGTVSRLSGELDSRTRMLLTEIDLENKKSDLVAGSFLKVSLNVKTPQYLEIPMEALVLKQDKSYTPVVQKNNTVTFKEIKVADNDGKKIHVLSGLEEGETVALYLGGGVAEGDHVRPVLDEMKKGAAK